MADAEPLEETRRRFAGEFERIPSELSALKPTRKYPVETSDALANLARSVAADVRARELA